MKSRVIASLFASVPDSLSRSSTTQRQPRVSLRPALALLGAACVLTLSGCYYPYGYYPGGYSPYYATAPAGYAQQEMPVGQYDANGQPPPPMNPGQQPRANAQTDPQVAQQTYAVAAPPPPPVYVAPAYPAYPAYYPPPVYPGYYGYPGWYGPSVSIGFGWGGGWGGHYGHGRH
jgi:hypothetical protein